MRILHIIYSMEIGGAQRLLSDLLPLLAKGHQVGLLVSKDVDNDFTHNIEKGNVKVMTTGGTHLYSPMNILFIARLAKEYDVVHVHLFPMIYWAALASLLAPMSLVYTEHSTFNRRRERWYMRPLERFVYNRYKMVISISQQVQNALTEWLKVETCDERFVVIENGVNLSGFLRKDSVDKSYNILIMISRFSREKDQMTLIRALKLLPDGVRVIFVGDGENMESCKQLAIELGVQERTHFVGAQTDVASWIARADIGIQSSKWEGFGLTAVEMMAAGLPVVASDVDGLKQVVGGAGILFEAGNAADLAHQVGRLLNDNQYYRVIGDNCKERASYYDIKIMAEKYIEVYKELYNL